MHHYALCKVPATGGPGRARMANPTAATLPDGGDRDMRFFANFRARRSSACQFCRRIAVRRRNLKCRQHVRALATRSRGGAVYNLSEWLPRPMATKNNSCKLV